MTTPTLDLPERCLRIVRALLQEHLPQAEVWAFGSRVRGTAFPASDLDLVVRVADDLLRPTVLTALRQALSDSNLPIRVDVLDWARIPTDFRDEIARACVVLQPAPAGR
jgi:uncharacterized protein